MADTTDEKTNPQTRGSGVEGEGEDDSSIQFGVDDDERISTEIPVGKSEDATPNANSFGDGSYTYEVVDSQNLDFDLSPEEEEIVFDDPEDEDIIEEEYEDEVLVDDEAARVDDTPDEARVDTPDEALSPKQVQFEGVPDEPRSSVQENPSEEGEISDPSDELESEILAAAVLAQTDVVEELSDPVPGGEQHTEYEQKGDEPWDETEGEKQPSIDPATGVDHGEEPAESKLASEGQQPQYDEYYSKLHGEEEYDVEEEEDESDESEFSEPIPEVVHSIADENGDQSSYDEAHEFDASEDSEDGVEEEYENEDYRENMEESGLDSNAKSFAEDTGSGDDEPMPPRQGRSVPDDDYDEEDPIVPNSPGLDGESHQHYVSSQPQDSGNVRIVNLLDSEHHNPDMKLQPRLSKSSFEGGSFYDEDEFEAGKSVEMNDRRKYCIPILFLVICTLAAVATVLSIVGTRDGKQLSSRAVDLNSTQSPSFLRTPSPSGPSNVITPPRPTAAPSLRPTGPPDNDVCLTATGVLPNDVPVDGTLFLAGGDNVDECQTVPSGGLGVWYFVIGTGGEMLAHTCNENTAFDTLITIFTGSCAKPECVEANDNFCGRQSAVSWISSIQQTYWILVHGNVEAGVDPSFQLSVLTRFNDECSNAVGPVKIGDENLPVIGDTRPATVNSITCGDRVNDSPSVWYRVRGSGAEMTVNVCQGPAAFWGARISLFTGICRDLECFAQSDSGCVLNWQSTPFRTYYIMVSGLTSTSAGVFGLKVTSAPAPENDSCLDALGPLPADGVAIPGSTVGAAVQITTAAPQCEVAVTGPGLWYFVEGDGTLLQASLCEFATEFDTRISIYSGDCSNGGTARDNLFCVGGNDDFCGFQSLVTWQTVAGTTYYILVHGYLLTAGSFELTLERV
jgi:hypothetical protein